MKRLMNYSYPQKLNKNKVYRKFKNRQNSPIMFRDANIGINIG